MITISTLMVFFLTNFSLNKRFTYRVHPFPQSDSWDVSKVMVPTQVLQILLKYPEIFDDDDGGRGADEQEKCPHCGR